MSEEENIFSSVSLTSKEEDSVSNSEQENNDLGDNILQVQQTIAEVTENTEELSVDLSLLSSVDLTQESLKRIFNKRKEISKEEISVNSMTSSSLYTDSEF